MPNAIQPQEFLVLQDLMVIRTKCPIEFINDEMILKRVRNANLAAGERIIVQCMNSDQTELLAECEYRVTSRRSEMKTVEINDQSTRQFEDHQFQVKRWTPWTYVSNRLAAMPELQAPAESMRVAKSGPHIAWNVGKRGYDVKIGDKVTGFSADKAEALRMLGPTAPGQ